MKARVTFVFLVLAVFSASSCGSSASPVIPAPPVPQISGDWIGEETVAGLTGGDCLTAALEKDLVGFPGQFSGTFAQTGASITATLDIDHTGAVCNYSGTVNGASLTLDMTGCTSTSAMAVSCPAGGARNLVLLTEHVTAGITGDRISGNFAETDNILLAGSSTSVGTLGTNGSFILMRR